MKDKHYNVTIATSGDHPLVEHRKIIANSPANAVYAALPGLSPTVPPGWVAPIDRVTYGGIATTIFHVTFAPRIDCVVTVYRRTR